MPNGDCRLCALLGDDYYGEQVEKLEAAISALYTLPVRRRRVQMRRLLEEYRELGLTVPAVEKHHRFHRGEVPEGFGHAFPRLVEIAAERVGPREFVALQLAARLGVTTVHQVATVAFSAEGVAGRQGRPYSETLNPRWLTNSASRTLRRLVNDELLYRVPMRYPPKTRREVEGAPAAPRQVYAITSRGIAVMELLRDEDDPSDYTLRTFNLSNGLRGHPVRHDVQLGDVLCAFHEQARLEPMQEIVADGQPRQMQVNVKAGNFWGARHLALKLDSPPFIEAGRQRFVDSSAVLPDGLLLIGVRYQGEAAPGAPALDVGLPLFVENDSGLHRRHRVMDALEDHAALALSGAPGKRFPELGQVPPLLDSQGLQWPLWVPVLLITEGRREQDRGDQRTAGIARDYAALIERRKWVLPGVGEARPPAYICTRADFYEHGPMGVPVVSLHRPGKAAVPLLRALLADSQPIWRSGKVRHDHELIIKRKGAGLVEVISPNRRRASERDLAARTAANEARAQALAAERARSSR